MNQTITVTTLAVAIAGCASWESKLGTEPNVPRAQAEITALKKAPGGKVKESELEEEHGKLVWSFDITRPGTRAITEVLVDAKTGKVVSTEVETPQREAAEKAER